jgi:hypothetical protein
MKMQERDSNSTKRDAGIFDFRGCPNVFLIRYFLSLASLYPLPKKNRVEKRKHSASKLCRTSTLVAHQLHEGCMKDALFKTYKK